MNVQVNLQALRHISQELYEVSSDLAKLASELETVFQDLGKQTVLSPTIKALNNVEQSLRIERYQFVILAHALSNIVRFYSEADEKGADFMAGVFICPIETNSNNFLYFADNICLRDKVITILGG